MKFTVLTFFCLLAAMSTASGIPGGHSDADIKSELVQTMAKFAVEQFAAGGGDPAQGLGELISAKKQVVAGTLTTLTYKRPDGSKCDVSVWDQSWTKKREITQSTCGHVIAKKD